MDVRKAARRIAVAVLGFAGVLTLAAFRGPPGPGGGPMGGGPGPEMFFGPRLEKMLDSIDATPQQRQQIKTIADRLREKGKAMRADHQQEREQLIAKFEAGQLDRSAIVAQMDRRAEQMRSMHQDLADAIVQVQNLLTPEQRAKVAARMREQPRRMQRGQGDLPPPPPPAPQK